MMSLLPRLAIVILAIGLSGCGPQHTEQTAGAGADRDADEARNAQPESEHNLAAVTEKEHGTPGIALDGGGLRTVDSANGKTHLIAFGTGRVAAEMAIAAALGPVENRLVGEECGAGPMGFSRFGPLTANFLNDEFVGWFLRGTDDEIRPTTMSGIGIGTTREHMAESLTFDIFDDSTIGVEFYTGGEQLGGISGLLSTEQDDATITDIWAGANCIFR